MRPVKHIVMFAIAIALLFGWPSGGLAQLRGAYPPGFAALESGSQGPPGIDVFVPAYILSPFLSLPPPHTARFSLPRGDRR